MSDNSFIVKKSLSMLPQATAPLNPTKGDLYKDLNFILLQYNGSSWIPVGSGSGAGDLDTLFTQTFDNSALSDFVHTGLVLDETTELNGSKSAKLIHQAGVNQSFKETISIPEKYRGQNMTFSLIAKSGATLGNVTVLFRDETNAVNLQSSQQIQADSTIKAFQFGVNIPSTCLSFSYTITALPQAGSPVTLIDDVAIKAFWMGSAMQGQTEYSYEVPSLIQSITHNTGGVPSENTGEIQFNLAQLTLSGDSVISAQTDSANTRTKFVALVKCTVDVSFRASPNTIGHNSYITKNGAIIMTAPAITVAGYPTVATSEISLEVGEFFTVGVSTTPNADFMYLQVVARGNTTKKFRTNDLVPAKSMNGSASIDVPKITVQSAYMNNSTAVAASAKPVGPLNSTSGVSNIFTYNSSTGEFTLLKDATVSMQLAMTASAAIAIGPCIMVNGVVVNIDSSVVASGSRSSTSYEGFHPIGTVFSGFLNNGSSNQTWMSITAVANETETKTWSSTQTLVQQEKDSFIKIAGFTPAYGSTNTKTHTFINGGTILQNIGDAIQYLDDSVLGARFVAKKKGFYRFSFNADISTITAYSYVGFGLNSAGNIDYASLPQANRLSGSGGVDEGGGGVASIFGEGYLEVGDIVRVIGHSNLNSPSPTWSMVTAAYQGTIKAIQTVSDQKIEIPTHELRFEGASTRGSTDTTIVKFDTMAKIKGDAFSIVNTVANGTVITMLKDGKLDVQMSLYKAAATNYCAITKNQVNLSGSPTSTSELIASNYLASTSNVASGSPTVSGSALVKAGDVIRVFANLAPTADAVINFLNLLFQEQTVSVSVSNTLPQFTESDSSVRVDTANGYGSIGTKIRRFANIRENIGSDVSYIDSITNGASFVANVSGVFNISYTDNFVAAGRLLISKNQTDLTLSTGGLPGTQILRANHATAAGSVSVSWEGYLNAGDVIRASTDGTAVGSDPSFVGLTMTKVGKSNVTGIDCTPFINIPQPISGDASWSGWNGNSVGGYQGFDSTVKMNGNGIFVADNTDGSGIKFLKRAVITASFMRNSAVFSNSVLDVYIHLDGAIMANNREGNGGSGNTGGLTATYSGIVEAGQLLRFSSTNLAPAYGDGYCKANIVASALADQILTEPEMFSLETANLQYSSVFTEFTLKDATVGTYITYQHNTGSSNAPTQTTTRPTQSDDDMRINGIRLSARAYTQTQNGTIPGFIKIQVGKGHKGWKTALFIGTGKTTPTPFAYAVVNSTVERGALDHYDSSTGIYTIDVATASLATNATRNVDLIQAGATGYFFPSASKNPALVGLSVPNYPFVKVMASLGQVIPTSVDTILLWDAATEVDSHNAFNPATGVFTAPENGWYEISHKYWLSSGAWAAGNYHYANVMRNGSYASYGPICGFGAALTQYSGAAYTDSIYLNKGDTSDIRIRTARTGGSITLDAAGMSNTLTIRKIRD